MAKSRQLESEKRRKIAGEFSDFPQFVFNTCKGLIVGVVRPVRISVHFVTLLIS